MDNMKHMIQELLGGMEERINTNQKKVEASMAKLLEDKIYAKMDSYKKKAEASMATFEGKMETMEHEMKHFLPYVDQNTQNLPAAKKTMPDPELMQSMEEYQEFPMGEAIVTPVKGQENRRRVQKLATERRQKLNERTQGYCGSRKRVTVAGTRTFCHARLAWHKRNVFRKILIQGSRELWKKLAADGIRMTHRAKVTWHRGHNCKLYDQDNVGQRTQKRMDVQDETVEKAEMQN
jgi:N-methylhydantoinase A/oxoprolinase/acetone carboxylase beta subunit